MVTWIGVAHEVLCDAEPEFVGLHDASGLVAELFEVRVL